MTKKNSRRFARSAFDLPRSALDECLPISIGDSNSVHFPTRAQNRLREETHITTRRRKTQSGGGTVWLQLVKRALEDSNRILSYLSTNELNSSFKKKVNTNTYFSSSKLTLKNIKTDES